MYETLISKIKKIKPNLKINSIMTYITSLKIFGDITGKGIFTKPEKIFKLIENQPLTTQKNRLTAIVVYLRAVEPDDKNLIDTYSKHMDIISGKYANIQNKQEKTDKQKENWITMDDFKDVIEQIFDDIQKQEILKKKILNNRDYSLLQSYVLLRMYLQFPLRNDLAKVKVITSKSDDNGTDNFLLTRTNKSGSKFYLILNNYKTVKIYGKKIYPINDKLTKLIKILLFFNSRKYLFLRYNREKPLSTNDLTKLLNRIFEKYIGKTVGTSLLRHIQISEHRKNDPTLKEVEEANKKVEDKFLHSSKMNNEYRKIK